LSILLVIIIPVAGVIIATAVALYNIGGERRELWLRARGRSLSFCEELADVCDGILATKSGPRQGSLPPVRTSLLLYLRKGLQEDLRRQILAGHLVAQFTMQPYAIDNLAHQISDTCVELHYAWELVTGARIGKKFHLDDSERLADEDYLHSAWFMRERVTLLHWQIATQNFVARRQAIANLVFGHTPVRHWHRLNRWRKSPPEEKAMSVNQLLG
jgi:hypothetical protein